MTKRLVLLACCSLMLVVACGGDEHCAASDDNLALDCYESGGDGYDCVCSLDGTTVSSFSDPDICDTGISVADVADLCGVATE